MVHSGGPSSQRRTSSGLVNASNTSRRGASKSRVTRISRSLGVDTLKLSGKNMEPPLPLLGNGTLAFLFRGSRRKPPNIRDRSPATRSLQRGGAPRACAVAAAHRCRIWVRPSRNVRAQERSYALLASRPDDVRGTTTLCSCYGHHTASSCALHLATGRRADVSRMRLSRLQPSLSEV